LLFKPEILISKMTDLKGYVYLISKVELEMFNEFELSTTFNGSENKQTVIVRTKLLYEQGADWKIDEVEFVGEFTGRIGRFFLRVMHLLQLLLHVLLIPPFHL
jgi:hypothetical protein